jgi:Putative MetA-pathway of phenol degradation
VASREVRRVRRPASRYFCNLLFASIVAIAAREARGETCPTPHDEIATDRPDVTNSSLVVPLGSFQSENGINSATRDGGRTIDATNTRWRLGIEPCLEILVDAPTYLATVKSPGISGWTDIAPALKWQISPIPGTIDLSMTMGVGLPTGTADVAGRGAQPYVQFPWSWELHGGWGLSGMFTEFFRPAEPTARQITEITFVIEKELTEKTRVFVEYVGDYPTDRSSSQLINSGAVYRLTPRQQIDFHIAFGLNHNAPSTIVGVGYSFRIDGLFADKSR